MQLFGCGLICEHGACAVVGKVALVNGDERGTVVQCREQAAFFVVERLGCVEDDQDDCSVCQRFAAAGDAKLLNFFKGLTQTGGVNQFQRNSFERDAFGYEIAGGSRGGGDDGSIAFYETIKQRALAGVGAADDGHCQSVVHDAAARE